MKSPRRFFGRCFATKRVFRCVLGTILGVWLAASVPASPAEGNQTPRVVLLNPAPPVAHFSSLILDVLRELNYEPNRNLFYTERWAGGSEEQLRRYAAELVALKLDAITSRQLGRSAG